MAVGILILTQILDSHSSDIGLCMAICQGNDASSVVLCNVKTLAARNIQDGATDGMEEDRNSEAVVPAVNNIEQREKADLSLKTQAERKPVKSLSSKAYSTVNSLKDQV